MADKFVSQDNTTEIVETSNRNVWNSLELTKILVGLLTPIAIFIFTKQTNERLDLSNKIQDNNKRVFENRQKFYDQVGTTLNDFYCYHLYVGHWKDLSPIDIVKKKRTVDQLVYTYSPFFDKEFKLAYDAYMTAIFQPYAKMGGDAKIRSESIIHKDYFKSDSAIWKDKWTENFTEEDNRKEVFDTYFALLQEIGQELNLKVDYTVGKMPNQRPDPK